jgi:hypothetical protein
MHFLRTLARMKEVPDDDTPFSFLSVFRLFLCCLLYSISLRAPASILLRGDMLSDRSTCICLSFWCGHARYYRLLRRLVPAVALDLKSEKARSFCNALAAASPCMHLGGAGRIAAVACGRRLPRWWSAARLGRYAVSSKRFCTPSPRAERCRIPVVWASVGSVS